MARPSDYTEGLCQALTDDLVKLRNMDLDGPAPPPFGKALAVARSVSTSRTVNRGCQPATRVLRYAPALRVTAAPDRAGCS